MPEIIKLPGVCDMHVHLREPGASHKEDWFTGTSAAVAGGVVAVVDMPNTNPPTFTLERLQEKEGIAAHKAVCDYGFYLGSDGKNVGEFEKAYSRVFGLKLYLNETTGSLIIEDKKVLEEIFRAWPRGKPILVHAEGDALARAISLASHYSQRLHCCHVASLEDIERVAEAKRARLPVTCEVAPQHLFLTQKDVERLGPFAMMKPELGDEGDRQALWEHVRLKTVDCIATDHAPHTRDEKSSGRARWGVPGLETSLPLMLTAADEGIVSVGDVQRLMCDNPYAILGIAPDGDTYVEVERGSYCIEEGELKTKCGWSPFTGLSVTARVIRTVIRGTEVFGGGKITAAAGFGRALLGSKN